MQPALGDKDDELINEEIVQLEKGLHEQVIFHNWLNSTLFPILAIIFLYTNFAFVS